MEQQKDIFISYGRGNVNSLGSKQFTFELAEKLQEEGYKVWLDKNDIPLATDYQHEIDKGIEGSNNFLFIISPHSAKSVYCFKEIEKAVSLNKRIIPILHIQPSQETVETSLHPSVKQLNWLSFSENDDAEKAFDALKQVLEVDAAHLNLHTHFLYKAKEWESRNYRHEFYLTGKELKEAEEWLHQSKEREAEPVPTDLHDDFIKRSRRRVQAKRLTTSIATVALLLITLLSAAAGWYNHREKMALKASLANLQVAKSNEVLSGAFQIACDYSKKRSLPVVAMAYKTAPQNPKAVASFYSTYFSTFPQSAVTAPGGLVFSDQVKPMGKTILFSAESGMIYLYDEAEQILGIMQAGKGGSITGLAYDEAWQVLYAQTDEDKTLAYPLDIDKLIESFQEKEVPQVSDDMLERYGIDKKVYKAWEGDITSSPTSSPAAISDSNSIATVEPPAVTSQSEPEPINTAVNVAPEEDADVTQEMEQPEQDAPEEKPDAAVSYEDLLQSTDVSALAKGWRYYYDQYKQNKETEQGRALLSKAVKLAELASYQDRGNTKLMTTLGKSSGELAWEYLLAGEPKQAIHYSKQGLVVAPKLEWILKYLLLGYAYNKQIPKALEVAAAINNKPYIFDDRYPMYNDAVLADLDVLISKGVSSPFVNTIRDALAVPLKAGYVEINDGVQSVNSHEVKLKIFARGASEMMLSNVATFNDNAQWEPYQMTKQWTLAPAQGLKYVYAKFRNAKGEVSEVVRAKVNLLDVR